MAHRLSHPQALIEPPQSTCSARLRSGWAKCDRLRRRQTPRYDHRMTEPTRLLLILDAFAGVATDDWTTALPASPKPEHLLTLSALGVPRCEVGAPPAWLELGAAVEKLAEAALTITSGTTGAVEFFVGGQAPLPLFAHLGFRLSRFTGKQTFLARGQGGGPIEAFDLSRPSSSPPPFTKVTSLPALDRFGSGAVAIFVDTSARPPPEEPIAKALTDAGVGSLTLLEVRSEVALKLTAEVAPAAGVQLSDYFSRVPSLFPKSDSLALFIAGPTLLAFLVGRSMNASLVSRVLLMNYSQGSYELAYALPFEHPDATPIDASAEGQLRRRDTRDALRLAIKKLGDEIEAGDVALGRPVLTEERARALVAQLKSLAFSEIESDAFALSLAEGRLSFGTGLLEAMRGLDETRVRDLARLFILHELVHDAQALRTTNFYGVGRAGVALEQVDYIADAFAIRTALRVEVRRGGPDAAEPTAMQETAVRLVETIVSGIEAFDQMEHGARIERLAERRLRRYLIWHLQLARMKTITKLEDVDAILKEMVAVELAPLQGRIDVRRYEKVVTKTIADTELFVALGGRLIRVRPSHEFEPDATLEALRSYGRQPLERVMNYIVAEHRDVFAPWRP